MDVTGASGSFDISFIVLARLIPGATVSPGSPSHYLASGGGAFGATFGAIF
jgi:hypothetical protein